MVDTIQELRTAGAEAIQVNGEVRVVAQTAVEDADRRALDRRPAGHLAVRHRRDRRPGHARRGGRVPVRARATSSRTTAPPSTVDELASLDIESRREAAAGPEFAEPARAVTSRWRAPAPTRTDRRRRRVPRRPEVHQRARVGPRARRARRLGPDRDHPLRPGRARRHRLRLAARGGGDRRRPARPAASSSRPSRSATSTPRSPARSSPATTRSTRRRSWSTATRTAAAGCSRSSLRPPAELDGLLDAAAYQALARRLSRPAVASPLDRAGRADRFRTTVNLNPALRVCDPIQKD